MIFSLDKICFCRGFFVHCEEITRIMTKEEKIKEAWGSVSCKIDENGWLFFGYACNGMDDVEDWLKENVLNNELDYYNITYDLCDNGDLIHVQIRPKSLQGIENNNGWWSIEEDDLPTQGTYLHFIIKGFEDFIRIGMYDDGYFWDDKQCYTPNVVTHYQQIEKPKPPIY